MDQFHSILAAISQADDCQLSEMVQAIIRRYGNLHPQEEILFLSLPRESPEERQRILTALPQMCRGGK